MLLWAVLGALLFFLVLAAAVLLWARGQVGRQRQPDTRQLMLVLASQAATDESGKHLLLLLRAMEALGDGPITVEWVRREPRDDHPGGMLVKIAWDGNEWRRILPLSPFREDVTRWMSEDPACESARGRQLLAELEKA